MSDYCSGSRERRERGRWSGKRAVPGGTSECAGSTTRGVRPHELDSTTPPGRQARQGPETAKPRRRAPPRERPKQTRAQQATRSERALFGKNHGRDAVHLRAAARRGSASSVAPNKAGPPPLEPLGGDGDGPRVNRMTERVTQPYAGDENHPECGGTSRAFAPLESSRAPQRLHP